MNKPEELVITLHVSTVDQAWEAQDLVERCGSPDDAERLREFIKSNFSEDAAGINIAELGLSVRANNVIERYGITTIGELLKTTVSRLMGLRGMGKTGVAEINKVLLERFNVQLAP